MISDSALQVLHASAYRQQEAVKENIGLIAFAGGNPKEAIRALERAMEEVEIELTARNRERAAKDQEAAKQEANVKSEG